MQDRKRLGLGKSGVGGVEVGGVVGESITSINVGRPYSCGVIIMGSV